MDWGPSRQTLQETGNITEYGRGQLDKCSQLVLDIQNVKLTHVFNAASVNGRLNVDWRDTEHPEGSGIGFKKEDKPTFMGFFYSKTKAMAFLAPQSEF